MIVCLGLTTLDVVHRVERLEPGKKVVATSTEVVAGGPAANAAVAAVAVARLLGSIGAGPAHDVVLISAVGDSPPAQIVRAELAAHGVRLIDLASSLAPEFVLPVASCVVSADGERTVASPGALTSSLALSEEAADAVRRADALLVDGHHPRAATEALGQATAVTVLDAGSRKEHAEAWLPRLDVVAGSIDYARGLRKGPRQTLEHVLAAGAGSAIVTDGPGDIVWASATTSRWGEGSGAVTPPQVDAVDTLGAGDAFHGALLAALATGRALGDAVALAASAASARVAVPGARAWLDGFAAG